MSLSLSEMKRSRQDAWTRRHRYFCFVSNRNGIHHNPLLSVPNAGIRSSWTGRYKSWFGEISFEHRAHPFFLFAVQNARMRSWSRVWWSFDVVLIQFGLAQNPNWAHLTIRFRLVTMGIFSFLTNREGFSSFQLLQQIFIDQVWYLWASEGSIIPIKYGQRQIQSEHHRHRHWRLGTCQVKTNGCSENALLHN